MFNKKAETYPKDQKGRSGLKINMSTEWAIEARALHILRTLQN